MHVTILENKIRLKMDIKSLLPTASHCIPCTKVNVLSSVRLIAFVFVPVLTEYIRQNRCFAVRDI